MRGQAAGQAAADVDRPQVAFRDEDDGVAVDGREPVVAVPSGGEAGLDEAEQADQDGCEGDAFFMTFSFGAKLRKAVFYAKR